MESLSSDALSSTAPSSLTSKDYQRSTTVHLMHGGVVGSGISLPTASAGAVDFGSHSHTWKVLLRLILFLLPMLSLVLCVASYIGHARQLEPWQNSLDVTRYFQDQNESVSYLGKHHLHDGEFSQNDEHPKKDDENSLVHQGDSLLVDNHGSYRVGTLGQSKEQHQSLSRALGPKNVRLSSSISFTSYSAMPYRHPKPKGRPRRPNIKSLMKIFQDLSNEGLLKLHHRILCLDYKAGKEVVALKRRGYNRVVGIDPLSRVLSSKLTHKRTSIQNVADESFDLVFTRVFDDIPHDPALFVVEIERILKVGGFAAMHVSLDLWHNRFISSKLDHAVKPVTLLFQFSKIVYVSTAYAHGLDTIIVFKKTVPMMVEAIDLDERRSNEFLSLSQTAVSNAVHPSESQPLNSYGVSSLHPKTGSTFLYMAKWASNNADGVVCKVLSRLSSFVDSLVKDVSNAAWARKLMIGDELSAVQGVSKRYNVYSPKG